MIQFSLVTKEGGILTKRYDLVDGELQKDNTQCFLKKGKIETIEIKFSELPEFLDNLKSNQAVVHGISIHAPSSVVAQSMLKKYPDAISRTKDNFFWPDNGLLMLDYDPPDRTEALSKADLITAVRNLHPEFKEAALVWRPSASSNIVDAEGTVLRGLRNQRIYLQYENPDNMDQFIQNLERAAWDKGLGYIFITAAGTALPRCIFDTAVFSPERLDFAAGAVCGDGLLPQVIKSSYEPGGVVDLDEVGDPYDIDRYNIQVEEAKRDVQVDITEARNKYKEQQAERLAQEQDINMAKARKIVSSRLKNQIMPEDILYDNNMNVIKVTDVILNQSKYNGMVIRDPLEPEYGASKAKIFADDEAIVINSFAHGGRTFRIHLDAECYIALLKEIKDEQTLLSVWTDRLGDFLGSEADRDKIAKFVSNRTGVAKTTLIKDIKTKERTVREERQIQEEEDDLSHHQIAERILAQLPKYTVATEGMLYSYNGANCWKPKSLTEMELEVAQRFDCLPKCCRRSDYVNISRHLYNVAEDPEFFHSTAPVIATLDACWILHPNGEVEKTKHHPSHRVRFVLNFHSVPFGTPAPLLDNFFDVTFYNENIQTLTMYESFGAIMFGVLNRVWHKAVLLRGDGHNGKNVTVDLLTGLIPSAYIAHVDPFQFNDPLYRADLSGKLANIMTELEKHQRLPAAAFKKVVDSNILTGKRLYQQPFDFPSIASHIFSSNHPVRTDDSSGGMKRRWLMFRYMHEVPVEDRIPDLGLIMAKEEGPQLFNYALEGVQRLYKNRNFTHTPSQGLLMREMFLEADTLSSFLGDQDIVITDTTKKNTVLRSGLYMAYRDWCRDNGRRRDEILSKMRFNDRLEQMGYELAKAKGQFYWKGISLRAGGGTTH